MEIVQMKLYFNPAVSMMSFYGKSSNGLVFWPSSEYDEFFMEIVQMELYFGTAVSMMSFLRKSFKSSCILAQQ